MLSATGSGTDGGFVGAATGGPDQFSEYFSSPPPSLEQQLPQGSPASFMGQPSDGRGLDEFLEGFNNDYHPWTTLSSTVSED